MLDRARTAEQASEQARAEVAEVLAELRELRALIERQDDSIAAVSRATAGVRRSYRFQRAWPVRSAYAVRLTSYR
ncbi:hypothetical protein GCM10022225_79850 [Plantactinospora mayteni]|uniref:Uncharacterized protein n=1 Tax=Plantactinospora mayteni TaxID=566021 RepID=A0ABQ4F3E2_9ACTN|nr:hypothetical protein [Plantactinospora mayteni]GIH01441.1 hypothetical protein Pma05_80130 [Plantactinospora mayteni]